MIPEYVISFTTEEHAELLNLFKDNPKWKSKIQDSCKFLSSNIFPNFIPNQYVGCSDSGFCFNCKIIVGNPTCFCSGGNCPKCGKHVAARSIPKDLNGIYEKHSFGMPIIKIRYENGEWKETIKI